MVETELQEQQQLKSIIEKSVDESVDRAFMKYGRRPRSSRVVGALTLVVLIAVMALTVGYLVKMMDANTPVAPVEDHDLTLENNGIFGFTVADFEEPILGKATRQRLLIIEEQDAYVNTTITETGLFSLGAFNKQQALTIHGTGQYTIDLTQITAADISLDEETHELAICIPHAELHLTSFDPSKTEVSDANNGWLAFGSIKMTVEQQQTFEVMAIQLLEDKLNEEECFVEADRFAKLAAYETFQPIIDSVSPAYKVVIEFQ